METILIIMLILCILLLRSLHKNAQQEKEAYMELEQSLSMEMRLGRKAIEALAWKSGITLDIKPGESLEGWNCDRTIVHDGAVYRHYKYRTGDNNG